VFLAREGHFVTCKLMRPSGK